jgi:hypothetical protein
MFNKSLSSILGSIVDIAAMTIAQFPPVTILLALLGLCLLTLRFPKGSVFLAVVFATNLVYLAGYTIPEIDTYLLPLVMIYALWTTIGVAAGCALILGRLKSAWCSRFAPLPVAAILFVIGLYMIVTNRSYADRSDYRYVQTQTQLLLDTMEPGAILLTANWDFYSPLLYARLVENNRTDVTAIDTELLRRSWYYKVISSRDAELIEHIDAHVKRFLPHVRRFERGEHYSQTAIEDAYQSIITAIASISNRPVYIDAGTRFRDLRMFSRVPDGPIYRLIRPGESYTPRPFSKIYLGTVDEGLLENDYSLKKQLGIIDLMNREWKTFWDSHGQPDTVIPHEQPYRPF